MLSAEPEGSCFPSQENATDVTSSIWPSSIVCSAPVLASQMRTVLSYELESERDIPQELRTVACSLKEQADWAKEAIKVQHGWDVDGTEECIGL